MTRTNISPTRTAVTTTADGARAREPKPHHRFYSRSRIRSLQNIYKANFHEKALFVKADVADPFVVERYGSASFAMLPFALSMSPRSSVTRCIVRSIFSDYEEGAAIFGSVSPAPCGGWTKFATCAVALC